MQTHDHSEALPDHPFESAGARDRFVALVVEQLQRQAPGGLVEGGIALLPGGIGIGLGTLAQACAQDDPRSWPEHIASHLALHDPQRVLPMLMELVETDFARLAPRLAVRLYPGSHLRTRGDLLVHRVDLEGTVTMLVLDAEDTVMAVPASLAAAWGVPPAQLLERGLQNVAAMEEPVWMPLANDAGPALEMLTCEHDFTASHVLRLAECLPRPGRYGDLIAIPNRHMVVRGAIDEPRIGATASVMRAIAEELFRVGPGSITPHVYLRRPDGSFERRLDARLRRR